MRAKREYRKADHNREEIARIRAIREEFQRDKPTLDDLSKRDDFAGTMTLGEVMMMSSIFASLKTERLRQRLTLAQLESKTGISRSKLSRLESGKAGNPTIATIFRVSSALGKTVSCTLQDFIPPNAHLDNAPG